MAGKVKWSTRAIAADALGSDEWHWPDVATVALKADVLQGIKESEKGQGIPLGDAMKMINSWLGRK